MGDWAVDGILQRFMGNPLSSGAGSVGGGIGILCKRMGTEREEMVHIAPLPPHPQPPWSPVLFGDPVVTFFPYPPTHPPPPNARSDYIPPSPFSPPQRSS